VHPDWFTLAAAISSGSGRGAIGLAICLLLFSTWVKKMPRRYGFVGMAALLTISFGAYLICERLRDDAFRRGKWQFTPFFINECVSTDFAAGCDLMKYKPVVISDWPWSERANPPNTGSVYGTVRNAGGRVAGRVTVCADGGDGLPTMGVVPCDKTDREGHFEIHGLRFGHYWLGACMGLCFPRDWPVQFALGPASRVKTVELRLLK
jgi:hypothetical protein